MAQWFDIGDVARLSVAFTDEDAAAADPTAVVLTVKSPSGVTTTPTVTQEEDDDAAPVTGGYHADVPLTAAGTWLWRWVGTGAVVAATEGHINVRASNFA